MLSLLCFVIQYLINLLRSKWKLNLVKDGVLVECPFSFHFVGQVKENKSDRWSIIELLLADFLFFTLFTGCVIQHL